MRKTGVREARQNLSALIEEVRKGHEITITDRGRPVARLVPPLSSVSVPFHGRSAFRRTMPKLKPPASKAVIDGREERH
jgi:prevent-host-death family protein